jgi:hypothetical protein
VASLHKVGQKHSNHEWQKARGVSDCTEDPSEIAMRSFNQAQVTKSLMDAVTNE